MVVQKLRSFNIIMFDLRNIKIRYMLSIVGYVKKMG
jgi:hypothetical protein